MAALDELQRLLVPPDEPIGTGSPEEWARLESRLGTRLPTDYKEFVRVYGAGSIDTEGDEFTIVNPFAGLRSLRLERMIATQREAHAAIIEVAGEYGDAAQQLDGLIPWGTNSFRGLCFWEPNGREPDGWTVHSEIDDDRMSFPENMTTYLLNVFRGVHDNFIYGVERPGLRLPMKFSPAPSLREVVIPIGALQQPGPVASAELARLGMSLDVVAPEEIGQPDVFLAVRAPRDVALELVDADGEWVRLDHAGFGTSPNTCGVYWRSGLEAMFVSGLVLEVRDESGREPSAVKRRSVELPMAALMTPGDVVDPQLAVEGIALEVLAPIEVPPSWVQRPGVGRRDQTADRDLPRLIIRSRGRGGLYPEIVDAARTRLAGSYSAGPFDDGSFLYYWFADQTSIPVDTFELRSRTTSSPLGRAPPARRTVPRPEGW